MAQQQRKSKSHQARRARNQSASTSSDKKAGTDGDEVEVLLLNNNRFVLAGVCSLLGFACFINTVWVCTSFVYDDVRAIGTNRDVVINKNAWSLQAWRDLWKHDFWGTSIQSDSSHKSYRPLTVTSFRIESALFSATKPWVFHFTNTLLYSLVCALVVDTILWKNATVKEIKSRSLLRHSRRFQAVLLVGAWFASHPIHTEVVAGLVGRAEILACLLCLFGGRLYQSANICSLPLSALCFLAASFCKETAVVMPVMYAGVDVVTQAVASNSSKPPRLLAGALGRIFTSLAVAAFYISYRSWLFAGTSSGQTLAGLSILDNFVYHLRGYNKFRTAAFIQAKYLQLLFLPDKLSSDYNLGVIEPVTAWFCPEMAFTVAATVAVVAWLIYGLVRLNRVGDDTVLLALGWTFAPLIPASHIFVDIGTVLAERLLFMPSVGATMILCHVCSRTDLFTSAFWEKTRIVLAVSVLAFSLWTVNRNHDWASTEALFAKDLTTYPNSAHLLYHGARHLTNNEEAFALSERLRAVIDKHSETFEAGRFSHYPLRVMANLKSSSKLNPTESDLAESVAYADEVIGLGDKFGRRGWTEIHNTKGVALLMQASRTGEKDKLKKAVEALTVAIEPVNGESLVRPFCLLGTANNLLGDNLESERQFKKCFDLVDEGAYVGPSYSWNDRFSDRRNYAILMLELSGYKTKDIYRAKTWGADAIEAIDKILAWPKVEFGQELMLHTKEAADWASVKLSILSLLKSTATEDELEDESVNNDKTTTEGKTEEERTTEEL